MTGMTNLVAVDTPIGRIGIVEMHWQQGHTDVGLHETPHHPTGPPASIATVHFLGPPAVLRKAGRLLQQAMNRAANVAEGAR